MKRNFYSVLAGSFFLFYLSPLYLAAQNSSRTYANFQGDYRTGLYVLYQETVFGGITNPGNATDLDPTTASVPYINAGLVGLATVTQFLAFTDDGTLSTVRQINAGTPVTLKFSMPSSLIGLADKIEVGTFTGLHSVARNIVGIAGTGAGNAAGYNATSMNVMYSGTTLVNLLNASGELELPLTPGQSYEGIFVRLSGDLLSLNLSTQLFHAYIMENKPLSCADQGSALDVLSGVKGNALVNLLSATGFVNDPWNAVDAGASALSTYSTISTGAQVLSEVFETVVFSTPSQPGDSLQMLIEDPGAGLLDLNLLGGMKIQPFSGSVAGSVLLSSQTGLSLRLLSSGGSKYLLSVPVNASFDRVNVSLGGVAGVLSQLRVYDVKRTIPAPQISQSGGTHTADTVFVYKGSSLSLTASSPDPVSWYGSTGTWLSNGTTYNFGPVWADGIYVAKALRNGCEQTSSSYTTYVKVLEHITLPVNGLQLSGQQKENYIRIDWLAKEESGVSHYTLQKSADGIHFSDIAIILAANATNQPYQFTDKTPLPGNNYYRLLVHDLSGSSHFSDVIQINRQLLSSIPSLNIFPNPFNGGSAIQLTGLTSGSYRLEITTPAGQPVWYADLQVGDTAAPVLVKPSKLLPGIYWLTAKSRYANKKVTATIWVR